jgi:hypothetical protein
MPSATRGRQRWIDAAERRLEDLLLAALRVRIALDAARDSASAKDILEDAGEPLLHAAAHLLAWLESAAAPSGLEIAVAELHAVAGVYRNAAVVYPGVPDLDGETREARTAACDAMLVQAEHHVAMFRALVT